MPHLARGVERSAIALRDLVQRHQGQLAAHFTPSAAATQQKVAGSGSIGSVPAAGEPSNGRADEWRCARPCRSLRHALRVQRFSALLVRLSVLSCCFPARLRVSGARLCPEPGMAMWHAA